MQATKICATCGVDKPLSAFNKQSGRPLGLRRKCKECDKAYNQARYAKNGEKLKAQVIEYQKKKSAGIEVKRTNYKPVKEKKNKLEIRPNNSIRVLSDKGKVRPPNINDALGFIVNPTLK